jgi:hypothetical protein
MQDTPNDPLKEDFKVFLYVVWQHLGLPSPTRSQYELADQLQYGPKRLVIEAFRGIGKSWVTCCFVAFLLNRDPDLKILLLSASKTLADLNSSFIQRMIMEIEFLAHLRPKNGQFSSKIMFEVGPPGRPRTPPSSRSASSGRSPALAPTCSSPTTSKSPTTPRPR